MGGFPAASITCMSNHRTSPGVPYGNFETCYEETLSYKIAGNYTIVGEGRGKSAATSKSKQHRPQQKPFSNVFDKTLNPVSQWYCTE